MGIDLVIYTSVILHPVHEQEFGDIAMESGGRGRPIRMDDSLQTTPAPSVRMLFDSSLHLSILPIRSTIKD